jgi:hypothetical protein
MGRGTQHPITPSHDPDGSFVPNDEDMLPACLDCMTVALANGQGAVAGFPAGPSVALPSTLLYDTLTHTSHYGV